MNKQTTVKIIESFGFTTSNWTNDENLTYLKNWLKFAKSDEGGDFFYMTVNDFVEIPFIELSLVDNQVEGKTVWTLSLVIDGNESLVKIDNIKTLVIEEC